MLEMKLRHVAPDVAQHRFVADAPQQRARLGGECLLERRLVETELVQCRGQSIAQARGQLGDRGGGGDLDHRVAGSPGVGRRGFHGLAGGARLGRRVCHALGQHLMFVDAAARFGDLAGALEGALNEAVGGGAEVAGVFESGGGRHRSPRGMAPVDPGAIGCSRMEPGHRGRRSPGAPGQFGLSRMNGRPR
jgi:hypothetical protein